MLSEVSGSSNVRNMTLVTNMCMKVVRIAGVFKLLEVGDAGEG